MQLTLPIQGVLQDVKHAFYGLCINTGKQVLAAMMEADRIALCGPRGIPDAGRRAVRGGTTRSSVVLGGQRIGVRRLRRLRGYRDMKQLIAALTKRVAENRPAELKAA